MSTKQITNGKAFEYALAASYKKYLEEYGIAVVLTEDSASENAKACYDTFNTSEKTRFDRAASATINTLVKIEPGLTAQQSSNDVLTIRIAKDAEGIDGDVRDVIFYRQKSNWEIGFSAKNNNDAVKHSRLSPSIDFGEKWLNIPCSQSYWNAIAPIFGFISNKISTNPHTTWNDLGDEKTSKIYRPLLRAFRDELLRIARTDSAAPAKLISYLIGEFPFYKIIKDDVNNLVVVKAFNINGRLNKTYNGVRARYKTPTINLPKRIVEFDFIEGSDNTLGMILDGGWEVSFRIHNASTTLEKSLKFDIKLLGNPPVLFSQYLFQE